MLKAVRAFVMLLVLVGTAYAGEIQTPPAPQPLTGTEQGTTGGETFYAETATPGVSDGLANAVLELLAILSALP